MYTVTQQMTSTVFLKQLDQLDILQWWCMKEEQGRRTKQRLLPENAAISHQILTNSLSPIRTENTPCCTVPSVCRKDKYLIMAVFAVVMLQLLDLKVLN